MPFPDEKSALHEFLIFEKVAIKIMRTRRGGHCQRCSLDILPTESECPICGDEIEAETVYFPIVGDTPVLIYTPDSESAQDLAMRLITDGGKNTSSGKVRPFSERTTDPVPPSKNEDVSGSRYDEILKQTGKLSWGQKLLSFVKENNAADSKSDKNRPKKIIPRRR